MNLFQSIKKKLVLTALLLPVVLGAIAQETTQAAAPAGESSNLLATLMIVTMIVLAIIIWGMGQALVGVSKLVMEKHRTDSKTLGIVLLIGMSLLSLTAGAQDAAGTTQAATDAVNYGGISAHNFYAFVGVLTVEVFAIIFLAFSIKRVYKELIPAKEGAAKSTFMGSWWDSMDKKFFTKAVPVEKEADVLLDHDYDGIKELDNALPPWWKYGFYVTILVGVFYIYFYHISGDGKNPTQEYIAEMEKAKAEKDAYEAKNVDKIDENKVPMADAAGVAKGQQLFETNCVACHMKGGGGNVGPNLTDDYWIHKGSLNDIYKSIKTGYPDKGMQPWNKIFTPKEMSLLASYVKTLRGTNPPGAKAPQGDLYVEEGTKTDSTAAAPKADSVKVKTDSSATKVSK